MRGLDEELSIDYLDRFSGLARLYGVDALPKLMRARIAVVGVGGVGSWAAEALARTGIGHLSLIDADEICVTNTNRQLPALEGQYGRPKVAAIAERLRLIQPELIIDELQCFFTKSSANELLAKGFDLVIDAIDAPEQKALLIASCRERNLPVVVSGGAAGKRDPSAIRTGDLASTTNDRLLRYVRRLLRRDHDFPNDAGRTAFGIRTVYSIENARYPWSDGSVREDPEPGHELRLNCDTGFGSAVAVTGAFGFATAAAAVEIILSRP